MLRQQPPLSWQKKRPAARQVQNYVVRLYRAVLNTHSPECGKVILLEAL